MVVGAGGGVREPDGDARKVFCPHEECGAYWGKARPVDAAYPWGIAAIALDLDRFRAELRHPSPVETYWECHDCRKGKRRAFVMSQELKVDLSDGGVVGGS